MKVTNIFDLQRHNIINIPLDPRTTPPANPVHGQVYTNTNTNIIYLFDGTQWISGSGIVNVTSNNGSINVNIANSIADLGINVDNATIEIDNVTGAVRIKDGGVTTTKLANGAVTTIKITDGSITFAKIQDIPTMTVIGRVAAGTGPASAITIINDPTLAGASGTNLATAGATKAYIDAIIAGIGTLIGSFNASTATQFPGTTSTKKGDYWYVTVAGTVNGVSLNVGDVLIANVPNPSPSNPNDWIFLETNRDQATTTVLGMVMLATPAEVITGTNNVKAVTPEGLSARTATETRTGLIEIATQAETNTGTDDTRAITPLKMVSYLNTLVGGYTTIIGNGSATSIAISHGLNTKSVIAEFFLIATEEKILVDYVRTSASIITAVFGTPPALNSIEVVIKK